MQFVLRFLRPGRSRLLPPAVMASAVLAGALGLSVNGQAQIAAEKTAPEQVDQTAPIANIAIPDLRGASEAQVRAAWEKLQDDLRFAEATLPAAVIPLYGQFLDQGGARYASVAIEVASRVGKLYMVDLRDFDRAIEAYDWGLANYRQHPDAIRLQSERLEALKAQAQQGQTKGGPGTVLGGATVPAMGRAVPAVVIPGVLGATMPQVGPAMVVPGSVVSNMVVPGVVPSVIIPSAVVPGTVKPELVMGEGVAAVSPLDLQALGINSAATAPSPLRPLSNIPFSQAVSSPTVGAAPVAFTPPILALSARPGNYLGWRAGPDRCVTALARQKGGRLWVATEDSGVWSCDETAPALTRWKQFRAADGLGDDSAYALAVDGQDRVWVGTLNHGVSVWNGQMWKNYGVLDGPLGERVFDIAVCPTDGDVWIATNAGLTRYSQGKDHWTYFTRAEGLPSDQIQAIAFDKDGNIVLGTQCDGVALAQAADGYTSWRQVQGPEQMPTTSTGKGLPSSLINDVLVAKDGTIYAATTTGLGWSSDSGANWSYVRGQDYGAKVKGRLDGPPAGWNEKTDACLAEDYVSCLAEDEQGQLWLGHWQMGSERVQMQSSPEGLSVKEVSHHQDSGFVRAIFPQSEGGLLLARYYDGLSSSVSATGRLVAMSKLGVAGVVSALVPSLPKPAEAPTLGELNALLASLDKIEPPDPKVPVVEPLPDDWTTQGDWLGHYGRQYAFLSAVDAPYNAEYFTDDVYTNSVHAQLGLQHSEGDKIRHWISSLQTDNPKALLYLEAGVRRQAELDDHGEAYPRSYEGPDEWFTVKLPAGTHRVSLYFVNKDGHEGVNCLRDYLIEVKPYKVKADEDIMQRAGLSPPDSEGELEDLAWAEKQPCLAKARVRDFWGGVYKQFVLKGSSTVLIKISRNGSYNTTCSGVFIDRLSDPKSQIEKFSIPQMVGVEYDPASPEVKVAPKQIDTTEGSLWWSALHGPAISNADARYLSQPLLAAIRLWYMTDAIVDSSGAYLARRSSYLMAMRVASAEQDKNQTVNIGSLLSNWRWKLFLWDESDRARFHSTMEEAWNRFQSQQTDPHFPKHPYLH